MAVFLFLLFISASFVCHYSAFPIGVYFFCCFYFIFLLDHGSLIVKVMVIGLSLAFVVIVDSFLIQIKCPILSYYSSDSISIVIKLIHFLINF